MLLRLRQWRFEVKWFTLPGTGRQQPTGAASDPDCRVRSKAQRTPDDSNAHGQRYRAPVVVVLCRPKTE